MDRNNNISLVLVWQLTEKMSASDVVNRIAQEAAASSPIPSELWGFERQGIITIGDPPAEVATYGILTSVNRFYEFSKSIQVRGWCFVLERKSAEGRQRFPDHNDPTAFFMCVYYRDRRYNLNTVFEDTAESLHEFTAIVVAKYVPLIIGRDVFRALVDVSKEVDVQWVADPPPAKPTTETPP